MAKSRRKHILNAGLKALIAGAETSTGLKMAATFISELAALPEKKQEKLGQFSQEEFNRWVSESGVATTVDAEEIKKLIQGLDDKFERLVSQKTGGKRTVRIVIPNVEFSDFDERNKTLLEHGLAQFLRIEPGDISVTEVEPGSVKVTVEIPDEHVRKLVKAVSIGDSNLIDTVAPFNLKVRQVFISYCHANEDWKDRVVRHLGVMEREGLLEVWDDRRIGVGEDWAKNIEGALNSANVAILMITADFLNSAFILEEEVPRLLERRKKEGVRVIPLIVKPCAWKKVKWLKPIQVRPKDGRALSGGSDHQIDTDLAALAEEVCELVGRTGRGVGGGSVPIAPEKIFTAKLPVTGRDLFGREQELKLLDEAWGAEHTHIVSLVAWGGVGKSALVNEWLNRMEADNWRGAERVYGWSFYSQGTREERQVSSDEFLAGALEWFGDKETAESNKSPWDKGVQLAELVREQRTLLILDGLEPLQHPPGQMQGRLKDQGLQALLKELSHGNPGLCVITTRVKVEDIENTVGKSSNRIILENLSDEAGAEVLKSLGVKGTKKELREASAEFGNHALALNLLGTYLAVVHGGEVRKRDLIPRLMYKGKQGEHARHVMESYEIWLNGKPELDILYVMGLFDRPADEGAIRVLREKPAIKGLTEKIVRLDEADWKFAVKNLRDLRLLAKEEKGQEGRLDCHPLIREHFGEKLREGNPAGWREAHGRLYEYYRDLPEKEQPDTLEEMEPLFAAVAHGCAAGRHEETFDDVYWERIRRGNEHYTYRKLGAFGADLAALSGFFEECWNKPATGLTEIDKAIVLSLAGSALLAVGRLREAVESMKTSLESFIKIEDWRNAANVTTTVSALYLELRKIEKAVEYGQQSVEFADKSGDQFFRVLSRCYLANELHQAGEIERAEELFRKAEDIQKGYQEYEYLYSLQGYYFCDLLLSQGKYKEVKKRAAQSLEVATEENWLLAIGLDNLSLGRAYMIEVSAEHIGDFGKAREYLESAVDGLRKSGEQIWIARGLLGRTEVFRHTGEYEKAWRDLEEVREIAERGEMKLYLADCALEACRLNLAEDEKGKAKEELKRAKELIERCGYHRRDREVEELAS